MARQSLQTTYADFRAGWVNTANPLQQPEGSVKDIVNFDIGIDGTLTKRSGLEIVGEPSNFSFLDTAFVRQPAVYVWKNVAEDTNRTFLVLSIQPTTDTESITLRFYDISSGVIRLDNSNHVGDVFYGQAWWQFSPHPFPRRDSFKKIDMADAFGRLFVTSTTFFPSMITYNTSTQSLEKTEMPIKIRDTELWYAEDDKATGLEKSEEDVLGAEHHYNLQNSGWPVGERILSREPTSFRTFRADILPTFKRVLGRWPKLSELYSMGRSGGGENTRQINAFSIWNFENEYLGNTAPPLGKFIKNINPFERAAGRVIENNYLLGEDSEKSYLSEYPSNISFYAGRLWYISNGEYVDTSVSTSRLTPSKLTGGLKIYYSQMFQDSFVKAARCYQENDPTDEEVNQLLATDGGVLSIKEAGTVRGAVVLGTSLIILTDRGVWSISGADLNSFDPTAFSIDKLLDIPVESSDSFVVEKGSLYLVSSEGLFRIAPPSMSQGAQLEDLSSERVKNFFAGLSTRSLKTSLIRYDNKRNLLFCLFNIPSQDAPYVDYKYNTILVYNENIQAFYKYAIEVPDNIMILDAIFSEDQEVTFSLKNVVDSLGTQVVVDQEEVVLPGAANFLPTDSTLQVLVLDTDTQKVRVATFSDSTTFADFGQPYSAYVDIGYESLTDIIKDSKQVPLVTAKLEFDFQGFKEVQA